MFFMSTLQVFEFMKFFNISSYLSKGLVNFLIMLKGDANLLLDVQVPSFVSFIQSLAYFCKLRFGFLVHTLLLSSDSRFFNSTCTYLRSCFGQVRMITWLRPSDFGQIYFKLFSPFFAKLLITSQTIQILSVIKVLFPIVIYWPFFSWFLWLSYSDFFIF